jgi:hypothetical protein
MYVSEWVKDKQIQRGASLLKKGRGRIRDPAGQKSPDPYPHNWIINEKNRRANPSY